MFICESLHSRWFLLLTVQPVSTESGRCFQELFWSCCPSVTWTGQGSCHIHAQRSNSVSRLESLLDSINLTQCCLNSHTNRLAHTLCDVLKASSCPHTFTPRCCPAPRRTRGEWPAIQCSIAGFWRWQAGTNKSCFISQGRGEKTQDSTGHLITGGRGYIGGHLWNRK